MTPTLWAFVSPILRDMCSPTASLSLTKTRLIFLGLDTLELPLEFGLDASVFGALPDSLSGVAILGPI